MIGHWQINFRDMIGDMMNMLRDNGLALPSDLSLMFKVFLTLDGFGRQLDPAFAAQSGWQGKIGSKCSCTACTLRSFFPALVTIVRDCADARLVSRAPETFQRPAS